MIREASGRYFCVCAETTRSTLASGCFYTCSEEVILKRWAYIFLSRIRVIRTIRQSLCSDGISRDYNSCALRVLRMTSQLVQNANRTLSVAWIALLVNYLLQALSARSKLKVDAIGARMTSEPGAQKGSKPHSNN